MRGVSRLGLSGLSLARLGWTIGFAACLTVYSTVGNLLLATNEGPLAGDPIVALLTYWFPVYLASFIPQMLAWTLVDNLPLRGPWRAVAFAAGSVLAVCTLPGLLCATVHSGDSACRAFPTWAAYREFLGYMVPTCYLAALIALVFLTRRRERTLAAALHASQLAGIAERRQLIEAELHAMQARVEPAFLFDTLRAVGDLYERDARGADRMFDHLIGYLRGALPDIRAAGTTVGREIELLRSYLGILALRAAGGLTTSVSIAGDLAMVRVPPMLLVPLVSPAGVAAADAASQTESIRVDVGGVASRVRITIAATGAVGRAIADSPAVGETRDRLGALCGTGATLTVDRDSAQTHLTIEIPNEIADCDNR